MSHFTNKQILVAVTGSIAAYKAAELVRQLKEAGADVRVAMTSSACEFVQPLTFQALSGHTVHSKLLDDQAEAAMGHIELARWADAIVIAPASADFIARLAVGRANDLLSAVCLATQAPIALAPAMNQHMWNNAATQANLVTLQKRHIAIFGPASGSQACGDVGPGRMLEPAEIKELTAGLFQTSSLSGKTIVITAGPTHEAIDPVRYITNRSSGKMGYAMAQAAIEAGANVILISGPAQLPSPQKVKRISVGTAEQMHAAVMENMNTCDIFIATAAVADYRPQASAQHKLKKNADQMTLKLVKNPDILAEVAQTHNEVFTVGFAAETHDVNKYAQAKLQNKRLNMIAANRVGQGIGFESDENALSVFWQHGSQEFPQARKTILARQLVQLISECYGDFEDLKE